jgi:hypothetical protein
MRRTTILISFFVFLSASSVALAAPGKKQNGVKLPTTDPAPTNPIDVRAQYGTSAQAVATAVSKANAYGVGLYFSGGSAFSYSQTVVLNGITAYGDGASSVLTATNAGASAVVLRGTSPAVKSLKITAPTASTRSGDPSQSGVWVDFAASFAIDRVYIDKVAGAGILNVGGSNGIISNSDIRNTLSDAVHNTHCAHNITVTGNNVYNPGDDMYAVVSYLADGCRAHDITVSNNVGDTQPWGRGISVVGGYNVTITGNQISHTYGAGIYIASEDWPTYGVDNVQINNNTIRYPDEGRIHVSNIRVWGGRADQPVRVVGGSGNICHKSRSEMLGVFADANANDITVTCVWG